MNMCIGCYENRKCPVCKTFGKMRRMQKGKLELLHCEECGHEKIL